MAVNENARFTGYASAIHLQDCSKIGHKSEKWQLRYNLLTRGHHEFFFDFILSLFSGLVNALSFISVPSLVLELRLFTINKWLTRIPKIEYTPIWVLGNIFRLELVTHTKFDTGVPNEMLINAAKRQGYSLSSF